MTQFVCYNIGVTTIQLKKLHLKISMTLQVLVRLRVSLPLRWMQLLYSATNTFKVGSPCYVWCQMKYYL